MLLSQSVCLNLLGLLEAVTPSSESDPVPVLYCAWSASIQGRLRVWVNSGQSGLQNGHHLVSWWGQAQRRKARSS